MVANSFFALASNHHPRVCLGVTTVRAANSFDLSVVQIQGQKAQVALQMQ